MRATHLASLLGEAETGVEAALSVVAGLDDALVHGLARPDEQHAAALAELAQAVAGTPIGERVAEAVEKIVAGSVAAEDLTALAGGRAALLGAVHDALLSRLDTALGRTRARWPEVSQDQTGSAQPGAAQTGPAAAPVAPAVLGACRSWLTELAIAGWRGVNHDLVSAAGPAVEATLADPGLRRLAVLLDGLAAELRASCPVATMERLPVRRWADLWSRALLLAHAGGWPDAPLPIGTVSGRLLIIGADVHEHETAVQVQVHGILEPTGDGSPRLVRTSVLAAKVDTIAGSALWRLLSDHSTLLGALAGHRALELTDLPLLASGDLVWQDERARLGDPVDPFATARLRLAEAQAPGVPPLDRHPVRIAGPVLVEGYSVTRDGTGPVMLRLDGSDIEVAIDRLPACGPLTPDLVTGSTACLGLLRWDGGRWLLQPVAITATVKRTTVGVHNGDWALGPTDPKVVKAEAKAGDAVAVLRERAGRLLRR